MPFTPFHMGPGLAVKVCLGNRFSLLVFGFSQIAMDIEPLVRILRGDAVLHGFTHTYFGATLVALVSIFVGRPICQHLLMDWLPDPYSPFLTWLRGPDHISWTAAIAGAFIGTYSHVLLDSIMHADIRPFAPFSAANGLFHFISVRELHIWCVASFVIACLLLYPLYRLGRSRDA